MSTHKNLAAALAAVQAELPTVHKGKTADTGKYRYNYASLDDVAQAIHPLLARNGLAFTAFPTLIDSGHFVLRYSLLHGESGEERTGDYPLPDPAHTLAQTIGSAVSYARRYTLCSVTGVTPDEDDDGQAAQREKATAKPRQRKAERGPDPDAGMWETPAADKPTEVDGEFVETWLRKLDAAGSKADMTGLWAEMIAAARGHRIDEDTRVMLTDAFGARSKELGLTKETAA